MRYLILILVSIIGLFSCQLDLSNKEANAYSREADTSSTTIGPEPFAFSKNEKKEGDIIFQTSLSSQSMAIQQATNSKYSHMGVLFREKGEWFVFEAIQPVSKTPLKKWINRGEKNHFVVKRLKEYPNGLAQSQINTLKRIARQYQGKDYDIYFGWSNEQIYCSELVWKIYQEGLQISLCELKELQAFDLSGEIVKKKLMERYGNQIPLQEKVVSPEDIFQSELLMEIETD